MKISVSLGLTICTDPEIRNFARFGCEITEIDTDLSIEAQAREGVTAVLKTMEIANEGLAEGVSEALGDLTSIQPETLREQLQTLVERVDRVQHVVVPNIANHVKKLQDVKIEQGRSLAEQLTGKEN